jgi:hypothetical protein
MISTQLTERLRKIFARRGTRRALLMGGSVLAASFMGFATPELVAGIHAGLVFAVQNFPLQDALITSREFFVGALSHVSSVGIGLETWANSSGVELARNVRDAIVEMKIFMGDAVWAAKELFDGTISQGREFASFWMDKAGETVDATMEALKSDFPGTVKAAGEKVGKALVAVAEVWGVYKALDEIYDWSLRRLGRRAKAAAPEAAPAPVTIANVETLQITIAIGGETAAETATIQLADLMKSANIEVPEALVQQAVDSLAARGDPVAASRACGRAIPSESPAPVPSASDPDVLWMSEAFRRDLAKASALRFGEPSPEDDSGPDVPSSPDAEMSDCIILKRSLKNASTSPLALLSAETESRQENHGPSGPH